MQVPNSIDQKMICGMLMGTETSPNSIPNGPMENVLIQWTTHFLNSSKVKEHMLINQPSSRIEVHAVTSLSLCEFHRICI